VSCVADYYRAARRLLRSEELLTGAPDALFFYALAEAIEDQSIDDERGAWLTSLWHSDARGAIERIGRVWRKRRDIRLLAQGAKHGSWHAVRAALPRLRRRLRRAAWPHPAAALPRAANLVHTQAATIAFVGGLNSLLRERVERDLAPAFPAGLTTLEQDYSAPLRGIDVAVVFDPPDSYRPRFEEIIAVDSRESLAANAVKVERALIGWLERRVERRNPEAVVGANPLAARMLQFACRHRVPVLVDFLGTLLNCGINCRLRSPILMPHPYGIFIHRNAVIGSRVTVMHQVTIGNQHPSDPGVPVIEDNVCIGAGAKILGAVRIGHGATVGANAVVTRDVPSHCTVVGANRILGAPIVAAERQTKNPTVVNT